MFYNNKDVFNLISTCTSSTDIRIENFKITKTIFTNQFLQTHSPPRLFLLVNFLNLFKNKSFFGKHNIEPSLHETG